MMQTEAAKKLIEETFNQPYDLGRFKKFLTELTKGYEDRSKPSIVPDNFKDGIKSVFRIGKFKDAKGDEIDLVAVTLQNDHSLDRARTFQRNYIARYLKGREKDAALVAFVAPESGSWRFSLVRRELGIKLNAKGKTKAFDEISPARRFSFLVGKGEKTHTAKRQLMPLLETDDKPSLASLEKAFNIEKVTDEFFEEYRELFGAVKEQIDEHLKDNAPAKKHFTEKDISSADFAKRLLGQIVFLYFLQKKGWLGVPKDKKWGEGSKTFLRDLYEKAKKEKKNFFNDYLEPLFYETLNRDHSDNNHYSKLFDSRIPFLNGGLFDAYHEYDWGSVDIELSNEIFSKHGKSLFAGIDGVGILDVFDRYNFTVAEDEPLEREVAIDPEMLGKVFERLLPAAERGDKGTFYTPREIVHYMCQESLISYLSSNIEGLDKTEVQDFICYGDLMLEHDARVLSGDKTDTYKEVFLGQTIQDNLKAVDNALAQVKVCDPAIGSGAFPVGMMSEIVRARKLLAVHRNVDVSNYDLKRDTIHNSLYGVDLDSGAIEIAKLRLWLSLVVDEDSFDNIQALPNLDYKIMQGNSLLQTYEGISLFKETLLKSHDNNVKRKKLLQEELDSLRNTLQTMKSNASFAMSPEQTKAIEEAIKKKTVDIKKLEKPSKEQAPSLLDIESKASELAEQLKKLHADFFRSASPSEKKKLRTRIEELEWQLIETSMKEQGKSGKLGEIKTLQKANVRPYFLWKLHFNEIFAGESCGFDIVIGNPPYIKIQAIEEQTASAYKQMFSTAKGKFDIYLLFVEKALSIINPHGYVCFIHPHKFLTTDYGKNFKSYVDSLKALNLAILFGVNQVFDTATTYTGIFGYRLNSAEVLFDRPIAGSITREALCSTKYSKDGSHWQIINTNPASAKVLSKIESNDKLANHCEGIYQGIVTVGDDIFILEAKGESNGIVSCYSHSINGLVDIEASLLKPVLKGEHIRRYKAPDSNLVIIYPHFEKEADKTASIDEVSFKKQYPLAYNYMLQFKDDLIEKKIKYKTNPEHWYSLHRARQISIFNSSKIITPQLQNYPNFTIDNDGYWYLDAGGYSLVLKKENQKRKNFYLGLLNSSLLWFYIKNTSNPYANNYYYFKTDYLSPFPMPISDMSLEEEIAGYAKTLLKLYEESDSKSLEEISKIEKKLNNLVYKLYKLDTGEIEIIESARKDAQKEAA